MAVPVPTPTDAERLLNASRAHSPRDRLLIQLVCLEGLTLHETLRLNAGDIKGHTAYVSTKNDTRRAHALASELATLVDKVLAGRLEGPLFLGMGGTSLRPDQARKIIMSAMSDAGIVGASLQALRAQLLAA